MKLVQILVISVIAMSLRTPVVSADIGSTQSAVLPRIGVSGDGSKLVSHDGMLFTPWGFNYDRDYKSRLIEDYWIDEWETVAADFAEMKTLGANIVRIHLSVSQFLDSPEKPNAANVLQLRKLVRLCEELGVYLDVTGLGCYRKEDVPDWFSNASEEQRWQLQARFWEVVAEACAGSPAVAWFDLMNEPVVPGDKQKPREWLVGHLGEFWYGQYIVLDPGDRDRGQIARDWVSRMSGAIRKRDPQALITVGMLPFSRASATQPAIGFDGFELWDVLDLICVHVYPKAPPFEEAMSVLDRFDRGRPLVVEEYFPLACKPEDIPAFVETSKKHADGWIGFYWGQTPEELEHSTSYVDIMTRGWLKAFQSMTPRK